MGISEPQPLACMQPGDVIVPPALASVSAAQGRMAACPAFDILVDLTLDRLPPIGVCKIPEVARVGMSEEAAFEVLRVMSSTTTAIVHIQRSAATPGPPARLIILGEDDRGAVPRRPVRRSPSGELRECRYVPRLSLPPV
jgi:hypothetical protein